MNRSSAMTTTPSVTCSFHNSVVVPERFLNASTVGPLRLADVPLSAIDFHVSDVLAHLSTVPGVRAASAKIKRNTGGVPQSSTMPQAEAGVEGQLKSAMWAFRSSLNSRRWLWMDGEATRMLIQRELEEQAMEKNALEDLWRNAAPQADVFSRTYIKGKFR